MIRCLLLGLGLLLSGCSGPGGVVVCRMPVIHADGHGTSPNLVLGPGEDYLWTAIGFNCRSSWPSVDAGYWFDDVTTFSEIELDDQFYYGRYGGYYRTSQSVRTGVRVR